VFATLFVKHWWLLGRPLEPILVQKCAAFQFGFELMQSDPERGELEALHGLNERPELRSTKCHAQQEISSMPSRTHGTSVPTPTPSNAFEPTFLEQLQAEAEPLTAAEAELAGPWKQVPVPGHPGAVAVLRAWEDLELGDVPIAVFRHAETARLFCALLPVLEREPLFHLAEDLDSDPGSPLPGGCAVVATFGEQGPAVCGWLARYRPEAMVALHLLEGLVRVPLCLAEVLGAAGPGALAQVGRYLASQQRD
jgi:hypothetical protein